MRYSGRCGWRAGLQLYGDQPNECRQGDSKVEASCGGDLGLLVFYHHGIIQHGLVFKWTSELFGPLPMRPRDKHAQPIRITLLAFGNRSGHASNLERPRTKSTSMED